MGNKKVLSKATRELNKTKRFATPKNIIEDPRGQWAHPGEITRIPSNKITMQGVPYPVMAYPNMGEPQMMYPGGEYTFPGADYVDEYPQMQDGGAIPVIEDAGSYNAEGYWIPDWEAMKKQAKELNAKTVKTKNGSIIYFDSNWDVQNVDDNPQMKRGGTPKSLVKMPKPSKKGLASKKFSRSLEATNRLFTENPLFSKPKSKKRKVFDPNAQYQDGGENAPWNPEYETPTTYEFQTLTPEEIAARDAENLMREQESWTDEQWTAYKKAQEAEAYQKALVNEPKYFDESMQFVRDWHDSPMYNQMVLNSYQGNKKNADYLTKLRKENIESIPALKVKTNQEDAGGGKLSASNTAAWSISDTGQVEVFPAGFEYGPSLYVHENFHSSDRPRELYKWNHPSYKDEEGNFQYPNWMVYNDPKFPNEDVVWHDRVMPTSDQRYISGHRSANWKDNEAYKKSRAEDPEYYKTLSDEEIKKQLEEDGISKDDPDYNTYYNNLKEYDRQNQERINKYEKEYWKDFGHGYVSDPTEVRARLGEIRYHAKKEGVYDPFTEQITPETFQQYINTDREKENWQPMKPIDELRQEFTDEEILWMLQNISKNEEPNEEIDTAKKGGEPKDKFKKRLLKRNPGMQGVYGPEGENLNIVKDRNYDAATVANAGNIEFMFPGLPQVSYPNKDKTLPDYVYVNPSPDKYTSVYNPRGANRGDIFLDMLHGMRDDQNYEALLQNFDKAVRDARGEDMQYFYEQAVANEGYTDSQEQYNDNYVDSQLRAQLAPGTIGMFSHGRKDYRMERKYDSPEMRQTAKDIKSYLKTPKEDYIETELTPEEIEEYRKGGFIVEDISVPSLNQMQDGGSPDPKTNFYTVEGSGGVYRKVNGKWEVDWNRSGKFQPLSKGDVAKRTAVLNSQAKPLYDATYDDLYATQKSAYTAAPKPTPAKKPTAQDKAAQEKFDKTFAVTGKSKMEVVEDKIQKGIDEYVKYHNEKYDEPLTQEEYDAAYQDIYNRAYINDGVYKPTMSGPVANPYGTTELRKNLISLDPGEAPKNLTLGDYVDKGWDIVTNPLDYASYALKPKGTVTTPWNMTNYENRLEAAGLEDPVTANNNVNKAIDFASWFTGPGMVAQGLKMVPGTVNSIGRAFENPSWENTGNAVWDAGMTALSIAPGFGIAKNLGKPASTIDDLKAIEALRGNTATTPFQSYYLTGNRALGTSEATVQQAEALRRFTGQQPLELPAGQYEWFNPKNKELYDNLQQELKELKAVSDELSGFGAKEALDKIDKSKVSNEAFKKLIMGEDLKFKIDDFPDTPRIPVRYAGLEQIRPGGNRISLNAVPETRTPSPRLPRGTAQQKALNDLENLRRQTITGQDEAILTFERLQEQKLKDLNTPEGRRRIQEFIDDNNIKGEIDEGNYSELVSDYETQLPEIVKNSDASEINNLIQRVKDYQAERGLRGSRNAKNSGLESWDALTAADLERAANPTGINDIILKENITSSLAKTDPKNTEGYKKLTVDDYIERIEETQYNDMSMQILGEEIRVKSIETSLRNKVNEKNQLRRDYGDGKMNQAAYKQKQQVANEEVLDLELQLKNAEASLKNTMQYLDRNNAVASLLENTINLGNQQTNIGNLQPAMYHEFGHITEASFLPIGTNSAIDRDLISGIDFLDEAPEYLFESLDPNTILSEAAPYNLTNEGISKYKDPDGYFNSSKEYFLKGGHGNPSMEPSAFAVELRPALKRVGLIKNDFDKVTPNMLEKLYKEYMSNPEFKFYDLRIFDIMKPTEKSFKTLSKNLNKIKGIAPYAIPVGLGVGAAGLSGQEEMQQDMEYQSGGIVLELSDAEIKEYKKGGWIVEEM
jgi:hypothetical protein